MHIVAVGGSTRFWGFPIPSTRLHRFQEYLSHGKLALILDLDETLFQVRITGSGAVACN